MKTHGRILTVLTTLLLVAVSVSGCATTPQTSAPPSTGAVTTAPPPAAPAASQTAANAEPAGGVFPLFPEKTTLNFTAIRTPEHGVASEMITFIKMEEMTNLHIEWDQIPSTQGMEKINLDIAAGNYPDAYWGAGFGATNTVKYGDQGIFLELSDYIEQYAPNLKRIMEELPSVKKGVRTPEGHIYGFPQLFYEEDTSRNESKFFINHKWLERVGKELPKTTEDLYDVLMAFYEQDANGNGDPNDEIPMSSGGYGYFRGYFKGVWGIQNRGTAHQYVDVDETTGELRFIPTLPQYKEYLQYMNRLYSAKLLDQEIFTNVSTPIMTAKQQNDLAGAISFIQTLFCVPIENFTGLEYLLQGPDPNVKPIVGGMRPAMNNLTGFVITAVNEYPVETVKWIDYFYSDEGAKLLLLGDEGVSYKVNPDGSLSFSDAILNAPDMYIEMGKHVIWSGATHPGYRTSKYGSGIGNNSPMSVAVAEAMKAWAPSDTWPAFMYTSEENQRMVTLSSDITGYASQMEAQFVTGQADFSTWDAYIAQFDTMGLSDYMGYYNAAYQRYLKD